MSGGFVSYVSGLRCRECARSYAAGPLQACEWCFGPLEVVYDYEAISAAVSAEAIAAGPSNLWRYEALLPVPAAGAVSLGAGFTPLVRAERLGAELGLRDLWVKNDTLNPTGSFKDRVVSMALTAAKSFGLNVAACASTGNLASSVAAHAAKAGMPAFVFVPVDTERAKVLTTEVFGARVVGVRGSYDQANRLCGELAAQHPDWAFANVNMRAWYAEGSKTLAFEVAEQLGWSAPDHVVVPVGSGSQLTKIAKGFAELTAVGLLPESAVRISGAQPAGCAPVATAFAAGESQPRPVRAATIARSLAIGDPADGGYALEAVRSSGGAVAAVDDAAIVEGIRLLARTEGIFAETAGGVSVATLAKLAADGVVRPDERVVVYITGNGLKTLDAIAPTERPAMVIEPRLDAFEEALSGESVGGAR